MAMFKKLPKICSEQIYLKSQSHYVWAKSIRYNYHCLIRKPNELLIIKHKEQHMSSNQKFTKSFAKPLYSKPWKHRSFHCKMLYVIGPRLNTNKICQ